MSVALRPYFLRIGRISCRPESAARDKQRLIQKTGAPKITETGKTFESRG